MFMNGTELVGLIRVYVDDFLVAGCDDDPSSQLLCQNSKEHFNGKTLNEDNFQIDKH